MSDGQGAEYGRRGRQRVKVRNKPDNHKCIYALDKMCIMISGFEVRRLEGSKIQVEAREGGGSARQMMSGVTFERRRNRVPGGDRLNSG